MKSENLSNRSVILVVIALVGLGLRFGAILVLMTYRGDPGAYEHAEIARSLAEGNGFRYAFYADRPLPSSHQAPAIPILLGLAYGALGIESTTSHLAFQLFLASLSILGVLAIASCGTSLWNSSVGLWAAAMFALYPALIYSPTRIQTINWSIPFLLAMMASAVRLRATWSPGWAVALAASGGLGMLGEPILFAPFALSWLVLLGSALRAGVLARGRALAAVGLTTLTAAAILAPWMVRNIQVHERFVFVKDPFWYVFWEGNNLVSSGTDKLEVSKDLQQELSWRFGGRDLEDLLADARQRAVSVDSALLPEQVERLRAFPTEMEKMDFFRTLSLEILKDDPGHYLKMCAKRLVQILWFDPTNPRSFVLPYRLPYLVLAILALAGILLGGAYRPAHAWTAVAFPLGVIAVFTLVVTSARFRLSLEAVFLLPAALAAWWVWERRPRFGGPWKVSAGPHGS